MPASTSSTRPTLMAAGAGRDRRQDRQAGRDWWIVATKIGTRLPPAAPNRGGSGRACVARTGRSLARLKTEHIDLYYLHLDDYATPLEETVEAMGTLIREGKIRYWGVSNFRGWRIAECVRLCDLPAFLGRLRDRPTTPSTGCQRSSTCRSALITVSVSCPIVHSRAVS